MLDWMSRTALELIGQGGLGYSFDSLTGPADNEFGEALKQFAYADCYFTHLNLPDP